MGVDGYESGYSTILFVRTNALLMHKDIYYVLN